MHRLMCIMNASPVKCSPVQRMCSAFWIKVVQQISWSCFKILYRKLHVSANKACSRHCFEWVLSWVLSELTLRFYFATLAAQLAQLKNAVPRKLIYSKYGSLARKPLNMRYCITQALRKILYYIKMPLQTELKLLGEWAPYLTSELES